MTKNEITSRYNIGEHIKLARKSLGLRQLDLAKMARLPASHLSDIERSAAIPTIPTLHKIGEALKRPLEYFFQEITDHPRSLGMVFQETSIGGRGVSNFVKQVKEKSQGTVNLRIYQQASLGSARDQITSLSQGGIHLFIDEPHSFELYSNICGPVFLPYFFKDRSHYYRFVESSIFDNDIYRPLLNSSIRILNPQSRWEGGNFELLFSKKPIFTPEDLKGKKMRTYVSEAAMALRRTLGAEPVAVEWENVYEAFEKGDIDVLLCPSSYFNVLKLHKVAKHATILRYGYTVNLNVVMSEKEYAKLRPSVQQALVDAADTAGVYGSELANKQTEIDLENLSGKYGVPVIQPDDVLWRSAFKDAIAKVCANGFLSEKLYDTIQKL
ncbi:MAG: helix-turn-helix domain-containing protein [bacterium]|nr:helix-turn-helix domain-containing protein [bacterium]